MKFNLSNLGYLKQATIELGDLTRICGQNNTGKTYVNYGSYGFLEVWKSNIDFNLEKEIETGASQCTLYSQRNWVEVFIVKLKDAWVLQNIKSGIKEVWGVIFLSFLCLQFYYLA